MTVLYDLTEEEAYLYAIISDKSGLDLAEFAYSDDTQDDGCFRAWPFQWPWWRCESPKQITRAARSVGKSLSIKIRAFAFPFLYAGEEMVVTAPQGVHLDAVTDNIETLFLNNRLAKEMIAKGRGGITHRPFKINFANGSRLMGRIPQQDGSGVKGIHPISLEQDECFPAGTLILTKKGYAPIEDVEVGTLVWTHNNRWRRVTKKFDRGLQNMVRLRGQGHSGIECSSNHKFWTMQEQVAMTPSVDSAGRKSVRQALVKSEPAMNHACDLGPGWFWSTPTRFDASGHIPSLFTTGPRRSPGSWESRLDLKSDSWAWLCGLWVAEGYASDKQCSWSVHTDEVTDVEKRLVDCDIPYSVYPQSQGKCSNITVYSPIICDYMKRNFGSGAYNKSLPIWLLRLKSRSWRQAFFDGAIYGDGNEFQNGWTYTTVSKRLSIEMVHLANSLDYEGVGRHLVDASELDPSVIRGREVKRGNWYQIRISRSSNETYTYDKKRWMRIREVEHLPERQHCYDIEVEEDHSFVVEGIVCSNSQDYPSRGWRELVETVKIQDEGTNSARWRAAGVTRGTGDEFDKRCKPGSGWVVHALPAMLRPNWTDEEREAKILEYGGSSDAVDYRRNVLGLPGDTNSPIFVLFRLMAATDTDENSFYNTSEYVSLSIDEAEVRDVGDITMLLDLPGSHRKYEKFWIGVDLGWTLAPTSIVILAEETTKVESKGSRQQKTRLKLLAKILLKRISAPDQAAVILHLFDLYRPKAFALDSTGAGLPLVQFLQEEVKKNPEIEKLLKRIVGYNFSEKIIAEFDSNIEIDEEKENGYLEAAIMKNVLEHSTDILRGMVDDKTFLLPYDMEIINEFSGQQWTYSKSVLDPYGRKRIYSSGSYHTLDACRMAVLAYQQEKINNFIASFGDKWEPPPMYFL